MKKFRKKLMLFALGLIGIFIVKNLLTPYYLGNPQFATKLDYFKSHDDKNYNTVFFGSSTLYRHVNTTLFDSILREQNLKSFNFATGGTYNPETFYLYNKFIGRKNKHNIKYAFIELQALDPIGFQNVYTTRKSYWNNTTYFNFATNYINNSNFDIQKKSKYFKIYAGTFAYSFLDFKILNNFFEINNQLNRNRVGRDGFYPLTKDMNENHVENGPKDWRLFFKADTTVLEKRRTSIIKNINLESDLLHLNTFYLEYLNALIRESEKHEIKLMFILPPRLKSEFYKELLPIAKALPQNHIINLSDPIKYKEFYQTKYAFDIAHLNTEGSTIFTTYLANEFRKRIKVSNE